MRWLRTRRGRTCRRKEGLSGEALRTAGVTQEDVCDVAWVTMIAAGVAVLLSQVRPRFGVADFKNFAKQCTQIHGGDMERTRPCSRARISMWMTGMGG